MIKEIQDVTTKSKIATVVLKDLPGWFGIEKQTRLYIEKSKDLSFIAYFIDEEPVGFLALKPTSKDCIEIFVMGVLKKYHHRGIGKKLYAWLEKYAQQQGVSYLQVKTVQAGIYSEYDCSNLFYQAMGFKELECFPTLWDENNPCQIYVKYIT